MRIVQIIEELRKELVDQGTAKGFQDPEVLSLSQKLDEFINAYYRMKKRTIYGSRIRILKRQ
jgi:hypothetical protein